VVSLARVPFVDLTALASLQETLERLHKHGVRIALCCANSDVADRLERAGIAAQLPVPASSTLSEAIRTVRPAPEAESGGA